MNVMRAANDNPGLDAKFERIPEAFLIAYQNELMGWAARLEERGPLLMIDLWNPPGATVLTAGWQGQVTLRCDLFAHPVSKKRRFVIQPNSEADAARVATHCEALPKIMQAHRDAAAANRNKPRGTASAVFNLPDYFVERYGFELREWGRNLKKIGLHKHIVLREGYLSDLSPNEEQGAVLIRVELVAAIERLKNDELRLVISAASARDDELIRKHCEKLQRNKIPARAQLVEPERPWLPFTPTVDGG